MTEWRSNNEAAAARTVCGGPTVLTASGCGALVRIEGDALVAATGPFASSPVFHAAVPGGVVVASTLSGILSAYDVSRRVDGAYVAAALGGWPGATATPFRAIRRLAPGARLVARGGCVSVEVAPSDAPPTATLAEALDLAVGRCSLGGAACALSGGLDSAALLAVLRSVGGARPAAFTIARPGAPDGELDRARAVAAHIGADLTEVEVWAEELPEHLERTVRAAGAVVYNSLGVVKYLFHHRVAQHGVRTLLSGVGADEVLLGDPGRYALVAGQPAFVRRVEPELLLGRTLLRKGVDVSRLEVPPDGPSDPVRRAQELELRTVLPLSTLPIERGTGAACGLDVRLPFLDPAVVACAAALPVSALVRGSVGKMPLREQFSHVLPSWSANLHKSSLLARPSAESAPVRRAWLDVYHALITRPRLEALEVVDPARAAALLERLAGATDPEIERLDRVAMKLASLTVLVDGPG